MPDDDDFGFSIPKRRVPSSFDFILIFDEGKKLDALGERHAAPPNTGTVVRPNAASLIDEGAPKHTTIARVMPTLPQETKAVAPTAQTYDLTREFHKKPLQQIYNPRQSPSAISSENFLAARALMSAKFVHNIAMTKEARISNLYKDIPKFRNEIDILA